MRWTLCLLLVASLDARVVSAQATMPAHPHGPNIGPCAACHSPDAWKPARISRQFSHAPSTFPLIGAHASTPCVSCHRSLDFSTARPVCAQCHRDVHNAELGNDCARCHTTRSFADQTNLRREHELTRFPLRGAHTALACASCHPAAAPGQSQYRRRPTACIGCHASAYRAARTPDHQAAGFPQDCTLCHSATTWSGGRFDHAATAFALTGAHRAASCGSCHADNVYKGKSTACVSCHQAAYAATTNPPHAASGFSTACAQCHGTASWLGSAFDHTATAFPLTGAHRASACAACHHNNVFRGTPKECVSCHLSAYNATTRPPHQTLALPTVCFQCHATTSWAGGTFDHGVTRFALTGAHRAVTCAGCHSDGIYRGKSMLCASCHQSRFDATTNPDHRAAAFPVTCETCHGTTAWTPSSFNHAATGFALTGAHLTAPCASCHGDGVYRGKPTLCSGCHLTTYNNTTNPNHTAASFPTACESCHTTARWTGATFNHDGAYFPIYSGKHQGRWSTCADCHTVSTNYKSFSCFSCHRQAEMDREHAGRTGYRYDNALCYQCHPQGRS